MGVEKRKLSLSFRNFFESEKSGGILLIICTVVSLLIANSPLGPTYLSFWHYDIAGLTVELWVNDLLMAIFFLLIGLELERELKVGELSNIKNAMLPIFAAAGGIAVPALIHFGLNGGTPAQRGMGIPMATDIAFALGVLSLLGSRVPASLKVFLAALAVIDDLGAILVIAIFYTAKLSTAYLFGSFVVFGVLYLMKKAGVRVLWPFLLIGLVMWFFMLKSGVHATIAGVMLAFAIPFSTRDDDETSASYKLEHALHKPVAFVILPIFALANTGIVIGAESLANLTSNNGIGIMAGLVVGKPVGIALFTFAAILFGICKLPLDLTWRHVVGAGFLGGIGFTMSIFITNLAFTGQAAMIDASKMSILLASLVAGIFGFVFLALFGQPAEGDDDPETMDFDMSEV